MSTCSLHPRPIPHLCAACRLANIGKRDHLLGLPMTHGSVELTRLWLGYDATVCVGPMEVARGWRLTRKGVHRFAARTIRRWFADRDPVEQYTLDRDGKPFIPAIEPGIDK